MATIKVLGQVDATHRLSAVLPDSIAPGTVEVLINVPEDGERDWLATVAQAWHAELSDPKEDIYTLDDGEPINGSR